MKLSGYLDESLVLTGLEGTDVHDVLHRLSEHIGRHPDVPSVERVEEALEAREQKHSTAMGEGLAVPHATLEGLDRPILAVAVAREPIPFGPEEVDPVRLFFVLLSPPGHARVHIKLLARICRLARHGDFIETVARSTSGDEVISAITRIDEQHV